MKSDWMLFLLVGTYSILISFYALLIGQKIMPTASQNELEEAAVVVAQELSSINVGGGRFGSVGLCDLSFDSAPPDNYRQGRQIGLNTLYATLRLDGILAERLRSDCMCELVQKDLIEARKIERDLLRKLWQSIQTHAPEPGSGKRVSIYDTACRIIAQSGHNHERRLIELTLKLGKLKSDRFSSQAPAPKGENADHIRNGTYVCERSIPSAVGASVHFYQLAAKPTIVPVDDFVAQDMVSLPSVVKLEATFESFSKNEHQRIITKQRACVLLGSPPYMPSSSVLMLSFPQGGLSLFSSLSDLIHFQKWNKPGQWRQAIEGPVPGAGHLNAVNGFADMQTKNAITTALYHWLFSLGPYVIPDSFERLLLRRWSVGFPTVKLEGTPGKTQELLSNSALLRDNGAANYALLYQSEPGGVGQKILQSAFSTRSIAELFPLSAIPVNVRSDGNCYLPGQTKFDLQLISDFISDLYRSNLAGLESRSVALAVIDRMDNASREIESEIQNMQEELRSTSSGMERIKQGVLATREKQKKEALEEMGQRYDRIVAAITFQEDKKRVYAQIRERATQGVNNAQKAVDLTFELCSHMSRFSALGINRMKEAYLLGKNLVFIPHTSPLTEDELYDSSSSRISWTNKKFEIIEKPAEGASVNGVPIAQFLHRQPQARYSPPIYVIFGSDLLTRDSLSEISVLDQSPFADSGIPVSQLNYYAADALRTGEAPPVKWSVLLRDLVAYRNISTGEPVASSKPGWCFGLKMEKESCPGLACEIQIRAPLPVLKDLPAGLMLQNSSGRETVLLLPPAPPELL